MKKHLFDSKAAKLLWKKSDDAIRRGVFLSELYDDVPRELKDVHISVLELHVVNDKKMKAKVMRYLNGN